jgi:BlaR1 peptidase M56
VAGVLLLIARLLADRLKVRRLARETPELNDHEWLAMLRDCAGELNVRRPVRLLRSRDQVTPLAIGIRHRAIVLPASAGEWSDDMRRAVLRHELAHIARHDCLTQTAAATACAMYWIHPGAWWLARRLRAERELACDDLVLSTGTNAHDYADHLLELAYTLRGYVTPALAAGMAAPGQIEVRLLALLDRARNRSAPTRRVRFVALAIFVAVLLPLATATVAGVQPAEPQVSAAQGPSRDMRAEWFRRFLSLDYWRQAAEQGLSRLADQASYLREMRELGYSVTDVDVLFKLRQRGVTPDFVRGLAAEGLSGLSADDLLGAANHGIDPEYVREIKGLGFWPLDMAALMRMRSHGIDGDFIHDMRTFGYRWSIDELVQATSHGIDPDFVLVLSSLGYEQLTLDELTLLRSHGVTPMRIRSANQRAGTRLTVNQLTTLASHGWKS